MGASSFFALNPQTRLIISVAYNVLDGTVDYSTTQHTELLDVHANQEIKGTKIIVGDLLAKDGRAIVPPAITELEGRVKRGL